MASRGMLILTLVVATTLCGLTVATDHIIGGPSGWNVGASLRTWAGAQTFAVGDNLVFSYPSAFHNVLEVTKSEFDSCQAVKPLITFANGNSIVPLTTPGKRYFICGMPGHCSQGMKFEVNVLSTAAAAATSPTAPLPNAVPSLNAPSPSSVLPTQPLLPLNPVPFFLHLLLLLFLPLLCLSFQQFLRHFLRQLLLGLLYHCSQAHQVAQAPHPQKLLRLFLLLLPVRRLTLLRLIPLPQNHLFWDLDSSSL